MEATGVYWKPVWHVLEEHFTLVLANAMQIRNLPGRKSDTNDARWIADLLAHRLIRSSFIPPAPIQALRDLTRTRRQLGREVARHIQRVQKTLEEDADVRQSGTVDGGQSSPTSGAARQTRLVRWLRQARFRPGVGLASVIRSRPRSGLGDSRLDAEDDARSSRSALGFHTRDALATASDMIGKERSHTRSVSRRTAFILVWAVGLPLGHGVGPWAVSLLSPRHGWATSGPGIWNALGLMPIAVGIAGLIWIMMVAFGEAPDRVELRQASFLLTRGPYAYSRNPMYVSELALWLGWAVFYGSVGVLIGFVIFFAVFLPGARYEERALEARFGDAYRAYKGRIPRWLGTRRRRN